MSLPSAADFEQLLMMILSPDNALRREADTKFLQFRNQNHGACALLLLQMLNESKQLGVRRLAAVLLRQMLTKPVSTETKWMYGAMPENVQVAVRTQLLQLTAKESHKLILNNLCECVSELAVAMFRPEATDTRPDGGSNAPPKPLSLWPELMPFLEQASQSSAHLHRSGSLIILGKMCSRCRPQLKPLRSSLVEMFHRLLNDENPHVRVTAMAAVINSINGLSNEEMALYQPLLERVVGVVPFAIQKNDADAVQESLQLMVDLADLAPNYLRPGLLPVVNGMIQLAKSDLDSGLRHLAVETLLVLCEGRSSLMRKVKNFVQELVPIVLRMMSRLSDNPEWNLGERHDIKDDDVEMGEESLDRLALSLGGPTLAPFLFSVLPHLLSSANWRERYAGVMAISAVGEGCCKFLTPRLGEIMKLLEPHFGMEAHPRVRWAALNAAGQLCSDFGPTLQQKYARELLTLVMIGMRDTENPRCQAHAASSMINFCDRCSVDILKPYLEPLLSLLRQLLGCPLIVQEQTVTSIAAISTCVTTEFRRFYNDFMPILLELLRRSDGEEKRLLRGKTVECVSLIAVAVGKDVFRKDAEFVMAYLRETQAAMKDDDVQMNFVLKAWARICKCLGEEFRPFLPGVIGPLLEVAKRAPDIQVYNREGSLDDQQYQFMPVQDKVIAIKTSQLEEKTTACSMLNCYADWLEEGFFPFVKPTAELLIPLLSYTYSDNIRSAASSTMPSLLRIVKKHFVTQAGPGEAAKNAALAAAGPALQGLWAEIAPALVMAIGMEQDPMLLADMMESLQECITEMPPGPLPGTAQVNIVKVLKNEIIEYLRRRAQRDKDRQDEDCDEFERESLSEEEEVDERVIQTVADVVGKLFESQRDSFLGTFGEELSSYFVDFLRSEKIHDRTVAMCAFDDLILYAGTPVALEKVFPMVLPRMLQDSLSEGADLRQSSLYGLGVASQTAPDKFAPVLKQALEVIGKVLKDPHAKAADNVYATENAISALGKIIASQSGRVNAGELLPQWLSMLPISHDELEARSVNELLCKFVESSSDVLLGANQIHMPHLLRALAAPLGSGAVTEALTLRMAKLIQALHRSYPQQVVAAASQLNKDVQAKLKEVLK